LADEAPDGDLVTVCIVTLMLLAAWGLGFVMGRDL